VDLEQTIEIQQAAIELGTTLFNVRRKLARISIKPIDGRITIQEFQRLKNVLTRRPSGFKRSGLQERKTRLKERRELLAPRNIPEVTWYILPALLETQYDSVAQVEKEIADKAYPLYQYFEPVKAEDVKDPFAAIELFITHVRLGLLSNRLDLLWEIHSGSVIILLPLAKFLRSLLRMHNADDLVYVIDDHEDFEKLSRFYRRLSQSSLSELLTKGESISTLVIEGFYEHKKIKVRETARDVIQLLGAKNLKNIYINVGPIIPRHLQHNGLVEIPNSSLNFNLFFI